MKKYMIFVFSIIFFYKTDAMLVEFIENNVLTNRFLSKYSGGSCPVSSGTIMNSSGIETSTTGSSTVACGNSMINDVINVNFLEGAMLNMSRYYIYNDFPTYILEMSTALNNTAPPAINNTTDSFLQSLEDMKTDLATNMTSAVSDDSVNIAATTIVEDAYAASVGDASDGSTNPENYPAVGVYQIELATCPSIQATVLPEIQPEEGQIKLVARLRYSGGKTYSQDTNRDIYLWSQDAICLRPEEKFRIVVSSDQDDTATTAALNLATESTQSVLQNYFNYTNSTIDECPAYFNATTSPRKIRLERAV